MAQVGAMTLFATHYHELTSLESKFKALRNAHMKVAEKNGQIDFLHTLTAGPAQKSYGIHVARLAGVPTQVTRRAAEILQQHELSSSSINSSSQLSLLEIQEDEPRVTAHPVLEELKNLQVPAITPLQALQKLAEWQGNL